MRLARNRALRSSAAAEAVVGLGEIGGGTVKGNSSDEGKEAEEETEEEAEGSDGYLLSAEEGDLFAPLAAVAGMRTVCAVPSFACRHLIA